MVIRRGAFVLCGVLAGAGIFACRPDQAPVDSVTETELPGDAGALSTADQVEREPLLADGNFTDPESRHWGGNAQASFRAGRVVLGNGGHISQVLPVAVLPGRGFRLHVDARSLEASAASLRLQAVWLPEGGWNAIDPTGKPVRLVEAETVHPGRLLQPYAAEISRPDSAAKLAIYAMNDGDVPIEILQVRLVSLEGS